MASYVMVFNFTAKGVENVHESPKRVEAAKETCRNLGGEVTAFYGLMGRYDTMLILEAPDDGTALRIAASISRKGNVRTETWRAFSEGEFRELVSDIA
jgi:uncharacterized protein with GYD domain